MCLVHLYCRSCQKNIIRWLLFFDCLFLYDISCFNSVNYFIASTRKSSRIEIRHKLLGEQAANIKNSVDRQIALKRIISSMMVMLARSMVVKVLSVLAGRWGYLYMQSNLPIRSALLSSHLYLKIFFFVLS